MSGQTIQDRRYELKDLIGRGGMGEVYRAHDPLLDRTLAIKLLPAHLVGDPEIRERFMTEARLAASLSHPNIVSVFDFGETGEMIFIAMPLVEGQNLDALIAESAPLPFDLVEQILTQLGSALDHAHENGLIHRDIKPGNVVLTPDRRVLLMDFGVAKSAASTQSMTQTGAFVGTPKYGAPEIIKGEPVDFRADLYSLGVVAYELITGQPPFSGDDFVRVAMRHVNEDPAPLADARPDTPAALSAAVLRLLAKVPADRFNSANHFLAEAYGRDLPYPARRSTDRPPGKAKASSGPSLAERFAKALLKFPYIGTKAEQAGPRDSAPARESATPPATDRSPTHRGSITAPGIADATVPPSTPPATAAPVASDMTMIRPTPAPAPPPPQPISDGGAHTMIVNIGDVATASALSQVPVALTLIASEDPRAVGQRIPLDRFAFVIGRDEQCDFTLATDRQISRKHVQIEREDGAFRVRDCGSSNGAFVNGVRLAGGQPLPLMIGDVLTLSDASAVRFVADIAPLGDLCGHQLDGRYLLEREVYSSLKATTYIARDARLPRTVAVKVFSPGLAALADYRQAYEREADIAARLNHPGIRKVIDRGEATATLEGKTVTLPYLCMNEMQGGNLDNRLGEASGKRADKPADKPADKQEPPTMDQMLDWVSALSEALDYAHGCGVVHAGLKPGAILFDEQDRPYLSDFAQGSDAEMATGTNMLGSPAFMAPEQWDGKPCTPASDQYSLACLFYRVLSGALPHEGQAEPHIRKRNFQRGAEPVHRQAVHNDRVKVPPAASGVLARAMDSDPAARYPSVGAFGQALVAAIKTNRRASDLPKIFLSYRREASAGWAVLFARELRTQHRIDVFVDTERRDSAVLFPDRLSEAIANCDVFVCLLADDTLDSSWVREEVRLAMEFGKPMVPVFQESYRTLSGDQEPHVHTLLQHDGVHLLDRRNIHVDHTIADIAGIVQRTLKSHH
ncbi:MAG: protein kinase [Pseudomonadota bacterium]